MNEHVYSKGYKYIGHSQYINEYVHRYQLAQHCSADLQYYIEIWCTGGRWREL